MTTDLAEIKKIGHNNSFCPAFCELLVNLDKCLNGCHFFAIYRSVAVQAEVQFVGLSISVDKIVITLYSFI